MRKYRSPVFTVLFIIAVAAFVSVCCLSFFFSEQGSARSASQLKVSWYNGNGIEIDVNDRSKISAIAKDNKYTLFHTAEEDISNACLAFKNSFSDTKILVNDKEVYSTSDDTEEEGSFFLSCSEAPRLHIVNLGSIRKDDVITVSVSMHYGSDPYSVSNILLGSTEDTINAVFRRDLLGIILCIALFTLGIILIIFYFAFRKAVSLKGVQYAGIFALLASLYSVSGGISISSLAVAGADTLYIVQCLAFVTMILPLIMFFMDNTRFRRTNNFLQAASVLQAAVIALVYVLGITGVSDLHQSETVSRWATAVQLAIILAALIYDYAKRNEKRSSDFTLITVYLIFLACFAAQFMLNIGNSIPLLFTVGALFFAASVLIIRICDFSRTMELGNEAEAMGKIAFTDGLTGVGNTAAFKKKLNHLEVVKVNYKSIGIVQFDINNLKTINDTLGHEMGDKLITDGSAMINKLFGSIGDVYRTGGDEFVAVVCCDNAFKLCNEAILKFELAIDEYNADETHRFMLQIAYGEEFYHSDSSDPFLTLREVQKLADKKMYEKKRELKEMAKREGLEVIRTNVKNLST